MDSYLDKSGLQYYTDRITEKFKTIFSLKGDVGQGALSATKVSKMTDKTKIYVYTGHETGYTFGDWYYWNPDTSKWVSGGVYNAEVVETDKTLTIEGAAADAKEVGTQVDRLEAEVNKRAALTYASATHLHGGDLDDILTPNTYVAMTMEDAYNIFNAPAKSAFMLHVLRPFGGPGRVYQIAEVRRSLDPKYNGQSGIFVRRKIDDSVTIPSDPPTPIRPVEPTAPGPDATPEETAAYEEAMAEYNTAMTEYEAAVPAYIAARAEWHSKWSSWQMLLTNGDLTTFRYVRELTNDDNIDNLNMPGVYLRLTGITEGSNLYNSEPTHTGYALLVFTNAEINAERRTVHLIVNSNGTLMHRAQIYLHGWSEWSTSASRAYVDEEVAKITEISDEVDSLYPGQIMQVLNRYGNITNSVYVAGSLNANDGTLANGDVYVKKYIRSGAYPVTDDMIVCASGAAVFSVYFWAGSTFVGKIGMQTGTVNISEAVAWVEYSGDDEIDTFKILCRFEDGRESDTILDDLSPHIYLVRQGGASFMFYTAGGIDKTDGSDVDTPDRQRIRAKTGMITETDCLVVPSNGILYSVFFYDADRAYIGCLLNRETADCIDDIMPEGTAGWRLMVRRADNGSLVDTYPMFYNYYGSLVRIYRGTTVEYVRRKCQLGTSVDDIYSPVQVQWERRAIAFKTGLPANSTNRISTPVEINVDARVEVADGYKFGVFYYGPSYLGWSDWQTGYRDVALMDTTPEEATLIKIVVAKSNDATITSLSEVSDSVSIYLRGGRYESIDDLISTYVHDIPPHIGVLNAILNFKQLTDIEYTAMATLPKLPDSDDPTNPDKNYAPAGTVIQGMVYSSSRVYGGFVPTAVSLHTFMSAAKSPHSYLYTVDLSKPPYNNQNGKTYYGTVCSVACSYALGLPHGYSTYQWPYIPGMEVVDASTAYDLKLGDTLVTSGHVVLVTDILRNKRGRIAYVTISEAANNVYGTCRSTSHTPEKIKDSYLDNNYIVYRYSYINQVNHEVSPFVAVEEEVVKPYVYPPVIPRKGDKSNYRLGEEVVIDILDGTGYTAYKVYKDGIVGSPVPLSGNTITPEIFTAGMYSVVLTDGDNDSDPCYFMVVDCGFSATSEGRTVTADISCSSNAVPYEFVFVFEIGNGVAYIADIEEGQTEFSLPLYNVYPAGTYGVRVGFKTEYGILYSDIRPIIIS